MAVRPPRTRQSGVEVADLGLLGVEVLGGEPQGVGPDAEVGVLGDEDGGLSGWSPERREPPRGCGCRGPLAIAAASRAG